MKLNQTRRSRQAPGFTMVELMVVISIIVVLAALTFGGLGFAKQKQATEKAKAQIKMLETSLEEYKLDFAAYPVVESGNGSNELFKALYWDSDNDGSGVGADDDQKIYLPELDPTSKKQGWNSSNVASATNTILDPWKQEYNYRSGKTKTGEINTACRNPDFDLWSNGPDMLPGNDEAKDKPSQDNITNWK